MQYVGMWGADWVVIWNADEKRFYALPLCEGYSRVIADNLDAIGAAIDEAKRIRKANERMGH